MFRRITPAPPPMTSLGAVTTDLVVGIVAGVAASLTMNLFQQVWANLVAAPPEPSATEEAAYHVSGALSEEPASPKARKRLASVIHYTTGAVLGSIYGVASGVFPALTSAKGTAFGTAAWAVGDEVAVPLLGLGPPLGRTKLMDHALGLASHLVFGLTLDFVRRHLNAQISANRSAS
jgi:putative membrane protein